MQFDTSTLPRAAEAPIIRDLFRYSLGIKRVTALRLSMVGGLPQVALVEAVTTRKLNRSFIAVAIQLPNSINFMDESIHRPNYVLSREAYTQIWAMLAKPANLNEAANIANWYLGQLEILRKSRLH
jgi:hypothetical protein